MTYIQLAYCTIQNNISFQILSWWLIMMQGLNAANWLGSGHPGIETHIYRPAVSSVKENVSFN